MFALTSISAAGEALSQMLEPVAGLFRTLNMPQPIVQWGHPLMMGIVVVVMGSFVAWAGWRGRLSADPDISQTSLAEHRKLAPLMSTFIALGYTGGLLSLVMQGEPLLSSPHFWTGSTVLVLLAINGGISLTGFGGNQTALRKTHAYLGSVILAVLVTHALLGLKLGLAL